MEGAAYKVANDISQNLRNSADFFIGTIFAMKISYTTLDT